MAEQPVFTYTDSGGDTLAIHSLDIGTAAVLLVNPDREDVGVAVHKGDVESVVTAIRAAVGIDSESERDGHPEPARDAAQVRPDPRQPAYDAVYENIRSLGGYLPPDAAHRNAVIWRAVQAALDATPVGRCMSSHCVEGDHIIGLGGSDV
ncbi:hypothetical protein [Streptomyces cyaneofuscatus]|uniref:hypothetical protein n=1 Tax=Streptomyces cyaneofuscatus TaxID=66883 RepID=UPI0033BEB45F